MDKKNTLLLTVIAVATLLVAVVGATFAYFTAQTGSGQQANIRVTTSTSDTLEYGSFDPITINANQQNFGQGAGNQWDVTSGAITLKANADNEASYCYTAQLNVTNNTFEYTVDSSTPELVFTVIKSAGDTATKTVTKNESNENDLGAFAGTTPIFENEDITTLGVTASYALTSDTSLDTSKTYYTRSGDAEPYTYTAVTSPVVGDIGTYYEKTLVTAGNPTDVYNKTTDTAIDSAKTYYTRSGSEGSYTYTEVTTPAVADIATYYEKTTVTGIIGTLDIPVSSTDSSLVHKITAAANTTVYDNWYAKVTFKNLDSDQQKNTNKMFVANLKFSTTTCPTTSGE